MKVDVTQILKSFNGKPIKTNTGTDDEPEIVDLTLRICITTALMYSSEQEIRSGPDANNRLKRFILAQEVYKKDEIVLSLDELTDLKKQINGFWATPVVASALIILDPAETTKVHNNRVEAKKEKDKEK